MSLRTLVHRSPSSGRGKLANALAHKIFNNRLSCKAISNFNDETMAPQWQSRISARIISRVQPCEKHKVPAFDKFSNPNSIRNSMICTSNDKDLNDKTELLYIDFPIFGLKNCNFSPRTAKVISAIPNPCIQSGRTPYTTASKIKAVSG